MSAIKGEVLSRYVIMLKMHHHQFVTRPLSIYSAANCCWRKILDTIKKRFHHFPTFSSLSPSHPPRVEGFLWLTTYKQQLQFREDDAMKNAHRYISKGKTKYHQGRWENIKSLSVLVAFHGTGKCCALGWKMDLRKRSFQHPRL